MGAGTWNFTDNGRSNLFNGTFDLDSNGFMVALFTSGTNLGAGSTNYAGLTHEHANVNGYTTSGVYIGPMVVSGTNSVTIDNHTDAVWTAFNDSITARYAVVYKNGGGGEILCYCLLDSTPADVSVTSGNSLTIQFHPNGIFSLS